MHNNSEEAALSTNLSGAISRIIFLSLFISNDCALICSQVKLPVQKFALGTFFCAAVIHGKFVTIMATNEITWRGYSVDFELGMENKAHEIASESLFTKQVDVLPPYFMKSSSERCHKSFVLHYYTNIPTLCPFQEQQQRDCIAGPIYGWSTVHLVVSLHKVPRYHIITLTIWDWMLISSYHQ